VITSAHCLPRLPPPHAAAYPEERTYKSLLGPVGGQRKIWAECLFADPVADIAVLGQPDDQELSKQAEAYDEVLDLLKPFSIADAPLCGSAWICAIDGHWFRCRIERTASGPLWLSEALDGIVGGMSGSPIRDEDGKAIGVVSISSGPSLSEPHTDGGPNPALTRNLPGWLLHELKRR
jgi:hypothetical protein